MLKKFSLFSFFLGLIVIIIIVFITKVVDEEVKMHKNVMISNAKLHYENIINTRKWNAQLGGVYTLSDTYKPNPYLPNNTLKDYLGRELIKINPAWMTRQLSELSTIKGMDYKIISNTPINEINRAEGYFKDALSNLEANNELIQYDFFEDTKEFKFIGALKVKPHCLQCHSQQGYSIGDYRGGIAITFDVADTYEAIKNIFFRQYTFIASILVIFMTFLLVLYKWLKAHEEIQKINRELDKKVATQTEEINRSNVQMQNVIKGAKLGYWDWDYKTGKHDVNNRWLEIIGLNQGDIRNLDNDWNERIHPDDKKIIMPIIEKAIEDKGHYTVEFRMLHKDGHYVWIEGSGAVVEVDESGNPMRLSGTHQDISQRKETQEEKENLVHDLGERMKELKCIYSIMNIMHSSHSIDYILEQSILRIPDGWQHPKFTQVRIILDDKEYFHEGFIKTQWLQVSDIGIEGVVRGRIEVYYLKEFEKLNEGPFLAQERDLLDNIAEIISETVKREEILLQLKHSATHDPLTGVFNRQMLDKRLEEDFKRALRYKRAFCVLMIDIDHFKSVNDTYGHQTGDLVLKETVSNLSRSIRDSDYIGRYGGEEFIVALTETDEQEALSFAERMRISVENQTVINELGDTIKITISVGISSLKKENESFHDLIKIADNALYKAKEAGRNQVLSF